MLPSIQARPGHRVHDAARMQVERTGRSSRRIERTSAHCGQKAEISTSRVLMMRPVQALAFEIEAAQAESVTSPGSLARIPAGCGKKGFPPPAPSLLSLPKGEQLRKAAIPSAALRTSFYAGCGM